MLPHCVITVSSNYPSVAPSDIIKNFIKLCLVDCAFLDIVIFDHFCFLQVSGESYDERIYMSGELLACYEREKMVDLAMPDRM